MTMQLKIEENELAVGSLRLQFPAVRLSVRNEIYSPEGPGERIDALTRRWNVRGITFTVSVKRLPRGVWRKRVRIKCSRPLPTPDRVELDRQTVPDPELSRRGYKATTKVTCRPNAEEEGGGLMSGCGYPLIGRHFFAGAEHPAAFATVESSDNSSATYTLVQHPVWDSNGELELADAVFCWTDNAECAFRDYLDSIRIPPRTAPMFSLCSFWSDPYLGNYEYRIEPAQYRSFVDAFHSMGIVPDVYTLDAGWQDRNSIFEPKPSFGGNAGLKALDRHLRKCGSRLGLWVSHNGPMGFSPDYLKSRGFPVGSGESATYCGSDYGVLLDPKFEKALGDRFAELARQGVMHLKMDWDNDCATNSDYSERYPTRDHVREGSINAMIRIAARIREANPCLAMRHGWWLSPWWLKHVHYVFLPDSGDSEHASLPSRTQRDSAQTCRDTMYYACFLRDRSAVPLDALDNHEFPHALRNPFHEQPGTASDCLMLVVMRGASYFPLTLQPEALEPWFADLLRGAMRFARTYGHRLYSARASMFGGNPNAGKIYGFRFEQKDGSAWCVLRNPSAMPQDFEWSGETRSGVWIYPYFARFTAGGKIRFAPHEVKVIILSRRRLALPYELPFQAQVRPDGKTEFRFPAQLSCGKAAPMVGKLHWIEQVEYELRSVNSIDGGIEMIIRIRLPYRMRNTTLNVEVETDRPEKIRLKARQSRYSSDSNASCQLPVTVLSEGQPGHGPRKNPDLNPPCREALFTVPCAEGGEAYYSLFLYGVDSAKQVRLSVSGCYAPSREALVREWRPAFLPDGLPWMHPEGFPMAEIFDLPEDPGKKSS